jgi:hypothetical protein
MRRSPYSANWQEHGRTQTVTLVPDALLDFHMCRQGRNDLSRKVRLEHDRGTEEQNHFRRRIRAYVGLLRNGTFNPESVKSAFTTLVVLNA